MNKRVNTILFILVATLVNIVIMLAVFVLLFVLFGLFLAPHVPEAVTSILVLLIFVGSITLTYFIYHKLVQFISRKVDMEKYFDPLFGRRKR